MNFLAHLYLAGGDEALRLGALLGDFVRGEAPLQDYPPDLRDGIRMHRHVDSFVDTLESVTRLRATLQPPFRRYAGIIVDLGFDHELARRWMEFSPQPLAAFDREVRVLLAKHAERVPEELARFMRYADRRGLFAAYAQPGEILHSLRGVGRRLSRPNPLHRVDEVWAELQPRLETAFEPVLAALQSEVAAWLKSRSTITGS